MWAKNYLNTLGNKSFDSFPAFTTYPLNCSQVSSVLLIRIVSDSQIIWFLTYQPKREPLYTHLWDLLRYFHHPFPLTSCFPIGCSNSEQPIGRQDLCLHVITSAFPPSSIQLPVLLRWHRSYHNHRPFLSPPIELFFQPLEKHCLFDYDQKGMPLMGHSQTSARRAPKFLVF